MAVELRGVTKVYGVGGARIVALDRVDLDIGAGELVALMGPSGSGKTTLLNLVATLDRPTEGKVYVLGRDVTALAERELERFRLRNVGYLFQSYNLVPYLTAIQNVALPLLALGASKELALLKAKALLELVGLDGAAGLYPSQLSGGMQQRVAIARALAASPPILVLDEPTSNIDVENASAVLSLVVAVNRVFKSTVLIATHDPDVAQIATRVVQVRAGRVYERGEPPRKTLRADLDAAWRIAEKIRSIDSLLGL